MGIDPPGHRARFDQRWPSGHTTFLHQASGRELPFNGQGSVPQLSREESPALINRTLPGFHSDTCSRSMYTCYRDPLSYGNATQPGSPHIGDQLGLRARQEMRPAWRMREELQGHIEYVTPIPGRR